MLEIFQYAFFRNALLGVLIIAVASAMIGTYIVARRLVAISGGVIHASFGGLGLAYFFSINPIIGAAIAAIAASVGVEWLSSRHRVREDSAIAVVWALGMAIGVLAVFMTPGYVPELNAFLFGNVLTISSADLWAFAGFTAVLIMVFAVGYRQIVACAFDRDFARVINLPVRLVSYTMTVMVAVCIVLTIRLVGIMLLMSMLALPQMIAETRFRRFRSLMFASMVVSAVCCVAGLLLGTVIDVPCSALIVLVMVALYIVAKLSRALVPGRIAAVLAVVVALTSLSACSMKKNTAASRQYSAFITRYNVYFNGDEHYKQTLREMEDKYEDDYNRRLLMHPAEARSDDKLPQPSGSFKRSIEKAQKAIQLRSIKKRPARKAGKGNDPEYKLWLKREEYNPFLHNAWMMMARSQYMDGDYLGAASTFYYINKHFWWLPETVVEAKLWQARCYVAADWLFEAESILQTVKEKDLTNPTLESLYYFTQADLLIRQRHDQEAIPVLQKAITYAKGGQKVRLTFLLGQLYADLGQRAEAYAAFKKVGRMAGTSYRTKFNARIKQSEVYTGENIEPEVKSLLKMTRFGRNKEYYDQIYYAVGNLYLSRADTTKAISYYEKAVDSSVRGGIEKAMAQMALGKLYYAEGRYDKAQPCYAEAIPQLPETYPDYELLKRRSDVLDEMAVYAQNVALQDSLLRLADMSPEEQHAVVVKIIDALKKKEKEEAEAAKREEYLAEQAANGNGLKQLGSSASAPSTFAINTDNSWYFYNQATRQAGKTDFQKRWGSRKLEDDWRRRNKMSYSFDEFDSEPADEENPEAPQAEGEGVELPVDEALSRETEARRNDPHFPEFYLRQIPKTEEERAVAHEVIQEGLYEMGLILKDKLDDIPAAEREFNRLLTQYPDNQYCLEVYYNMYLMYMRTGRTKEAEHYRQLILRDFPNTKYGEALLDPHYMDKLRQMEVVQTRLYDEAYEAYLADDNARVHAIYEQMRTDYPMSRIMPKFMFIEALTYVTENDPEKFSSTLRQMIERYPDTDVAELGSEYLKQLASGKKLHSASGNLRMNGLVWNTRLSNDSTTIADEAGEIAFDLVSDGPQNLILLYPINDVNGNQLLFDVARFNFTHFMVRDFELEQMKFGDLGLLVVSGFRNREELNRYRSTLEANVAIPEGVIPVGISMSNFETLLRTGGSMTDYFRATDDDRLEKIHRSVLPADEYPSAAEMYDLEDAPSPSVEPTVEEPIVEEPAVEEPIVDKPKPAPKADPKPTAKPAAKPAPKADPKPTAKPATKAEPKPAAKPLPQYPTGSEGDDPLFD